MESNNAEEQLQELQTKECAVCGEQYLEEADGDRCPLCKEYESIFDAAMNEVVDRTANRWRFTPSQLTISSRTITREEWEASGRKWVLTWEDEFERLMNVCSLAKIKCWSDVRALAVRICDEKHGVRPIHAFQILANVLRQDPKVCFGWESKVKYILRTKHIKFNYRIRKFSWTEKYVLRYGFECTEKQILPMFYDRKHVRQFDPWYFLIKMHRNFTDWLKTFAVAKGDIEKVRKVSMFRGEAIGQRIESRVRYDKIIQRLLMIEFSQGLDAFFKGDHPYAVAVRQVHQERLEKRQKIKEENIAKHEAKKAERLERQREQQAAYRERKKLLMAAMKRAEEYAAGKILDVNPMEMWPEVDE